jgi:Flp pilus assembly protein CpaB
LVLLIGIFLALIAFVLILVTIGNQGGGPNASTAPTTTTLVVATRPIELGATIEAEDVKTNDVPITDFPPNGIKLTSLVIGQIARQPVSAEQAVTTDVLQGGGGVIANLSVPAGHVAMAVQVDQVTGVGTIIKSGDYVDMVTGVTGADKIPLVVSPTARPGGGGNATPAPRGFQPEVLPYNTTTVKTLIQGVQVLGTLLPPPPSSGTAEASPGSGQETTLNGQQQIVMLALTPQDVEVVKFAQMDGNISLVLRSTEDCKPVEEPSPSPSPSGSPAPAASVPPVLPCPTFTTTGITLRKLIDDFGVIPPQVVEVIEPTPYPQFAP